MPCRWPSPAPFLEIDDLEPLFDKVTSDPRQEHHSSLAIGPQHIGGRVGQWPGPRKDRAP